MPKTPGEMIEEQVCDLSNGTSVDLTVKDIRGWFDTGDDDEISELTSALDRAQGKIHSGDSGEYFILVKVTK